MTYFVVSKYALDNYLSVIHGLDAPLDTQHLAHGVLVAVPDLELLPRLPKLDGDARVAYLATVRVDGAGAVDLAQLGFHLGEAQAHLARLVFRKRLDCLQK